MINIHELEKKWLKYKIKSNLVYIVLGISIIAISIILVKPYSTNMFIDIKDKTLNIATNLIENQKTNNIKTQEKVLEDKNTIDKQKYTINEESSDAIANNEINNSSNKLLITPSLGFIDKLENSAPKYYKKELIKNNTPVKKSQVYKNTKPKIDKPKKELKKVVAIQEPKPKSIKIKRRNNQDDINYVIKRFNNSNDPQLSLFISKKYYDMKEYKKAYNYALITNKIDKQIEDSWLIFAKSLVKLKRKDMSIKILNQYIKQSKSDQAKILLNEITSGKFK